MAPHGFLMPMFGPPSPSHGTPTPYCGGVHHVCSSSSHSVGSSMALVNPCGPCFPAPTGMLLAGAAGCHGPSSRTPLAPRRCSYNGSYPSQNDGGYGGNSGGGGVGSFGGGPSGTLSLLVCTWLLCCVLSTLVSAVALAVMLLSG